MFNRKPKHVHTWDTFFSTSYWEGYGRSVTRFTTLCVTCGYTGKFDYEDKIFSEDIQRKLAQRALENGWFK